MININLVKSLLTYYLKVRFAAWGIPTDKDLALPTDPKQLEKVKLVRKLYYNLQHHSQDREFLLAFCDELDKIETAERENHHSYYAPAISDYPFMACTIRALRSHILKSASPHKEMSEVQKYLEGEFLDVIKYEDKHYTGGQYQNIESIKDFVETFKKDSSSFGLLDRVYVLGYKAQHTDRKESTVAVTAMGVLQDTHSSNIGRTKCMSTLFAEKAGRKAEKAARPVLQLVEPQNSKVSVAELDEILAGLAENAKKDREFPALGKKM